MTGLTLSQLEDLCSLYQKTQKVPVSRNLFARHLLHQLQNREVQIRMLHGSRSENAPAFVDLSQVRAPQMTTMPREGASRETGAAPVIGTIEIVPVQEDTESDQNLVNANPSSNEQYQGRSTSPMPQVVSPSCSTYQGTSSSVANAKEELKKLLKDRQRDLEDSSPPPCTQDKVEAAAIASDADEMDEGDNAEEGVLEARRARRRARNRLAAQRCRLKKRNQTQNVDQECKSLEKANAELKIKVKQLESERATLHALIRKHIQKETPPTSMGLDTSRQANETNIQETTSIILEDENVDNGAPVNVLKMEDVSSSPISTDPKYEQSEAVLIDENGKSTQMNFITTLPFDKAFGHSSVREHTQDSCQAVPAGPGIKQDRVVHNEAKRSWHPVPVNTIESPNMFAGFRQSETSKVKNLALQSNLHRYAILNSASQHYQMIPGGAPTYINTTMFNNNQNKMSQVVPIRNASVVNDETHQPDISEDPPLVIDMTTTDRHDTEMDC